MTSYGHWRFADLPATPWRNGGGTTYPLAAEPPDASMDDFDWRVSIAAVTTPGPFSSFPGVDRILMLVSGGSMLLTIDGRPQLLALLDSARFGGDSAVSCEIPDGPTLDLNVMTRRGRAHATLELVDTADAGELAVEGTALLVCLSGQPLVDGHSLAPLDGVVVNRRSTRSGGAGMLAVVRLLA